MLVVCEGPLFVVGLVILIIGRFSFYGTQKLRGKQARILGLTLMLPGLAPLIGAVLGIATIRGISIPWTLTAMGIWETLILIGALIAAAIMLLTKPETPVVPQTTLPLVLTLREAADYLRVSEKTVLQLIENGDLPARKIEGHYRLDREEVTNFLKR